LEQASYLEQASRRRLKESDAAGAVVDARLARSTACWTSSVDPARREIGSAEREIAVSALEVEALGLAYGDKKSRGASVANVAMQLADSPDIHPRFALQAELTALHIAEMRRDLDRTMRRLWELGTQLQADRWCQEEALRAFARLIACAIWADDAESASRAMKAGDHLLRSVDDADARGSYLIWPAQALMRQDEFEKADELLSQALELREGTPRRAITDLYASAYFELKHGDKDVGMERFQEFLVGTAEAGLFQYARVGLETLTPLF
jgi:tetratricopeptide (TPR) repeat protein